MNSKRSGSAKTAAAPALAAVPPHDLTTILDDDDLKVIVGQYKPAGLDLSGKLVTQYAPIRPELAGIGDTLYPEFVGKPANALAPANRERCLVALLASRSRRLELAIHVYLALANGVTPDELAHIVVAAGIYTGVDTVSAGFDVLQTTFDTLQPLARAKTADAKTAIGALVAAFP